MELIPQKSRIGQTSRCVCGKAEGQAQISSEKAEGEQAQIPSEKAEEIGAVAFGKTKRGKYAGHLRKSGMG